MKSSTVHTQSHENVSVVARWRLIIKTILNKITMQRFATPVFTTGLAVERSAITALIFNPNLNHASGE
jgi:hypothetical protein